MVLDIFRTLAAVAGLLMAHNGAFAAKLPKHELCSFVASQKNHAVLLTEDGDRMLKEIELGEIDMSNKRDWRDFVPSRKKFRLIIKPKRIVLEDFCSLADCIEAEAVRPTCTDTREYIITFSLNPRKFGAGELDHEADFRLLDVKEQLPVDKDMTYAFDRNAKGVFRMGFGTMIERKGTSERILNLLRGGSGPVTFDLLNTGNSPLELGNWQAMDGGTGSLTLDSSGCSRITVPPGGICKLILDNPTRTPMALKYISWHNALENDIQTVSFALKSNSTGPIGYYIKNE
ncbi:hypothetical protein ABT364_08380 [Massilia sp. SR12]